MGNDKHINWRPIPGPNGIREEDKPLPPVTVTLSGNSTPLLPTPESERADWVKHTRGDIGVPFQAPKPLPEDVPECVRRLVEQIEAWSVIGLKGPIPRLAAAVRDYYEKGGR